MLDIKVSQRVLFYSISFSLFLSLLCSSLLTFFSLVGYRTWTQFYQFYLERIWDVDCSHVLLQYTVDFIEYLFSVKYLNLSEHYFVFQHFTAYIPVKLLTGWIINYPINIYCIIIVRYSLKFAFMRESITVPKYCMERNINTTHQFIQIYFHGNLYSILFSSVYFKHFFLLCK